MPLKNEEFMSFMKDLQVYLDTPKKFVPNSKRVNDVLSAAATASKLFKDMDIIIENDPLETGALIVCIKGFDINVTGKEEITLFKSIIDKCDNFEVIAPKAEHVEFNIVFNGALKLNM